MNKSEVETQSSLNRFITLTAIRGSSGNEALVAAEIERQLIEAGADPSQIAYDGAGERTRRSGDCGNLIVSLPGNGQGPRTLLSAHMDTVPICLGSEPVIDGDCVRSAAATGLGADDRAGCAAILTAVVERLKRGDQNFPPAVITFLIQEEVGLEGARHLDVEKVGSIDRAFNFDGGTVEKLTTGAIGGERIKIRLTGVPAHAGVAPEKGASTIVMAARAIADLDQNGWLGRVEKDGKFGTSNVGIIQAGDATNVITPEATLAAEARSHDPEMRTRIVTAIREAFQRATKQVANDEGVCGGMEFESHVDYESFRLPNDHPSIEKASEAVRLVGREPFQEISNGGLDANWLFLHGISAITLGCGQRNIHTAQETLDIGDYLDACRIASWLITDGAA
jgi:tripeptide aminopeptidase